MNNIACRIFKEQLDVILCLPEQEQGKAIIAILKNAFGIEYNHTELSAPAQSIVNLLKKTIVCKEFSSNYGGARTGAGRKSGNQIENQNEKKQTFNELIGQIGKKNTNSILIDSNFSCSKFDVFKTYINEMPSCVIQSVENWLKKQKNGQTVPVEFITKQFINFANRQNKPLFKGEQQCK